PGIHPESDEQDIDAGVVTHRTAVQVPGEREHNHNPQERQLRAVVGHKDRRQQRQDRDAGVKGQAHERRVHRRTFRLRPSENRRHTRMTTRSPTTNAAWYSAPTMNPATLSPPPSPRAATS